MWVARRCKIFATELSRFSEAFMLRGPIYGVALPSVCSEISSRAPFFHERPEFGKYLGIQSERMTKPIYHSSPRARTELSRFSEAFVIRISIYKVALSNVCSEISSRVLFFY